MDAITIAHYDDQFSTRPDSVTLAWDELCALLTVHERGACTVATCVQHRVAAARAAKLDFKAPENAELKRLAAEDCPHKLGAAWSPVRMAPGAGRGNAGVQAVTAAVFDLDHLTQDRLEGVAARLEGFAAVIHSTHSHRPPDDQCLRLVMPLARPVSQVEWRTLRLALIAQHDLPADKRAADPARLFFLPRAPQDAPVLGLIAEGRPIEPDMYLPVAGGSRISISKAPPVASGAISERGLPPTQGKTENAPGSNSEPLSLDALLADLSATRRSYRTRGQEERADLLSRVLDQEPLAEPGARNDTVNRVSSILGARLPTNTPWDAVREIVRPSIAKMETEPEGLEFWLERVQDSFQRAQARRIERDQKTEEINRAIRRATDSKLTTALEARQRGELPVPAVEDDQDEDAPEAPAEDDLAWAHLLQLRPVKDPDEVPQVAKTAHNLLTLLTHHPDWRNVLRFNEFTKSIEVTAGPLPPEDRHLSTLSTAVGAWLSREVGIEWPDPQVKGAILLAARRRTYDPLREYMDALHWDGTPRLDTALEIYAKVSTQSSAGQDITAHVRRVSSKSLIAAAARALQPGCKVDTVLVLEGLTGKGKSTFFKELGGRFFTTSQIDLSNKDSMLLAACSWMVELAELDAIRKSGHESVNGFLTTQEDRFRVPYGSAIEAFPRRAVFFGTSEDDDYLPSHKGARRWLPVRVTAQIDVEGIRRDRDQLWAEACVRARRALSAMARSEQPQPGDRWWFLEDEFREALAEAEERVGIPEQVAAIAAWWYRKPPESRPRFVNAIDVGTSALGMTVDKVDFRAARAIAKVMRHLGFQESRSMQQGVQLRGYAPSEKLLTARVTPTGSLVSMLKGGGLDIQNESGENAQTST